MRIRVLLLGAGALVFTAFSMGGQAEDIARWVDEEGVTHFGNPQFAPGDADTVTLVDVQPTNGMVVPSVVAETHQRGRVVVIKKKGKSNPRGWQGYQRKKKSSDARGNRRR
ncbi:MAG: hypothetical protein O7G86_06825 [Gammaproteobacteria bacterium]|nr:hypothetical protein [Gammaproteobacteria bacterium]